MDEGGGARQGRVLRRVSTDGKAVGAREDPGRRGAAGGPPRSRSYEASPSWVSSIPFGIAPTAAALGEPASKSIMFGID